MAKTELDDYVEHIRLTNLSVLLLCLGLVIALRNPFIQRVRTELDQIELIQKYFSNYELEAVENNLPRMPPKRHLFADRIMAAIPLRKELRAFGENGGIVEPITELKL